MKKTLFFIAGVCLLSLSACTSSNKIQKIFTENRHPLYYVHDSPVKTDKLPISVSVKVNEDNVEILDETEIKRVKGWAIPLIIFNIWKSENECFLGRDMLEQNLENAVAHTLKQEISRSGNFYVDTLHQADFELEVELKSIEAAGPYSSSGFFYFLLFFYGYSYADVAGPAITDLEVSYTLKEDGRVVLIDTLRSQVITNPINMRVNNNAQLIRNYAASMTEGITNNVKQINQEIVQEINELLERRRRGNSVQIK